MENKAILVVDDLDECLHLMDHILLDHYQPLFFAKNGAEAVDILNQHDIQLIITDYEMPGTDGMWLLERNQGVPTIVLSASFRLKEAELLKSGASAFVQKPFSVKALLKLIDEVFKESGTPHRAR